jgi:hypothetical protein
MQGGWYALGTLLTQLAFLVAGVWFARNFLRVIRAFQEQIGALLKLSITGGPAERQPAGSRSTQFLAEVSPYWVAPLQRESASEPGPEEKVEKRSGGAWRRLVHWLQGPMSSNGVSPWRRAINWLQAPVGS